ncbi:MAG: hypothetical protein ACLPVF_09445 [Acidimicrobiales bacterium]
MRANPVRRAARGAGGALALVGLSLSVSVSAAAAGTADRSGAVAASVPGPASVVGGRFVVPVELDVGVLTVTPAGRARHPVITERAAAREIWASPTVVGRQAGPLGYGVVTITRRARGVPAVRGLAAWVGFARTTASASCPAETGTVPPGVQQAQAALPSSGFVAVVIGAGNGSPAVSYAARSAVCRSVQPAAMARARQALSIPWRPVDGIEDGAIRVRATLPPCATVGGTSGSGDARTFTITVGAVVPDVRGRCAPRRSVTESVTVGSAQNRLGAPPPVVTSSTRIVHGRLGPLNLTNA